MIKEKKPYMSNRNLLAIAILSGKMSTYIGYLANLNTMLGVPGAVSFYRPACF